jgi:hypothetical protein
MKKNNTSEIINDLSLLMFIAIAGWLLMFTSGLF